MPEIIPMDRPMLSLREAMDRLLPQSFTPTGIGSANGLNTPVAPANVWEDADGFHVWLLVPGVAAETIQITAESGVLTVSGEMAAGTPERARALHQEWNGAKFERNIRLSTATDTEQASATYRDGVLRLHVPKAAHSRPRAIKVTTE
ncbi:MAG: Hsp20/alpha crystallin family protein [Chloroflexota bacterium]